MSRIHGRKDFEHGRPERTGILLSIALVLLMGTTVIVLPALLSWRDEGKRAPA